jgi:hypothetical protein
MKDKRVRLVQTVAKKISHQRRETFYSALGGKSFLQEVILSKKTNTTSEQLEQQLKNQL